MHLPNMLNEFVEEKPTLSRMVITKDYDLDEAASVGMLESAYKAFSI